MKTGRSFLQTASFLALTSMSLLAEPVITKKQFEVKPGGKLIIEADRGNVAVKTADVSTVAVTVEREIMGASASEQERLLKEHNLTITQDGNAVQVKAVRTKTGWSFRDPFNKLRVNYSVVLPQKFDADVHTAGGNVTVTALGGDLKTHSSGGHLDLAAIKGAVTASTSGGDVKMRETKGDANLHTSGGHIEADTIEGNLMAKTSGGNITIRNVTGALEAKTSGGHIRLEDAGGPIDARTSGGNVTAKLSQQPKGDVALRTSGGSVELNVPESVTLTIDAETSGGSVGSDFPAEINKSRTKLHTKLNGGGASVAMSTSGGNVRVKKN